MNAQLDAAYRVDGRTDRKVFRVARGRHVTHPSPPSSRHPSGSSKKPPPSFKSPTIYTQDINRIDGDSQARTASLPQEDPLTRRELASDALYSSSIENHCVLRPSAVEVVGSIL